MITKSSLWSSLSLLLYFIITTLFLSSNPSADKLEIALGSSLYASNLNYNWSSPNNLYSLSFIQSPISTDGFIAVIVYKGAAQVPIWSVGNGIQVNSGGFLHFLPTGVLRLVNGSGDPVWESPTANLGVSSSSLDDSGNFALNNDDGTVWSTFDDPTDTLIQSQNFTVGKSLKSGSYSFTMLKSGNLNLTWNGSVVYWKYLFNGSSGGVTKNSTSPRLVLQNNGKLSIFDKSMGGGSEVNVAFSNDFGEGSDVFRFLRLDSDGNLRIYSVDNSGSTNAVQRWAATDQCQVFGYCGDMGICSYNASFSPICQCPSMNFEFVDENDNRKGCKRKIELENCVNNSTMLQLNNAKFLTYQLDVSESYMVGISACSSNCLGSSSCVASTSMADGTGACYMKTPGFISGYQSPAILGTSFIKICGTAMPNPSSLTSSSDANCWRLRAWIAAFAVVTAVLAIVALVVGLWWRFCRNNPRYGAKYMLLEYASSAPLNFSYKELKKVTKGFKEKLGVGGFGAVYKGILTNKTAVAVKQLEGIEQGERQFRMEVATIGSTHHLNLVKLVGFCSEGRHRLLVYEFMKNGSLDSFLFEAEAQNGKLLSWENRINVALGTARGMTYLHEECRNCILHCDIKPENILLNENYVAKVSDFGLAKLLKPKDHRHRSFLSVRGTRGYLAPEWLANFPINAKSDVYSYGMVLLEIVSGRRNFEVSEETNWKKFSVWAYEEYQQGNLKAIVDKRLAGDEVNMEQVMRAIQVSFWCTQEQPSMRPTMGRVVQMLEGILEIDRPPAPMPVTEGDESSIYTSHNASSYSTSTVSAPHPSSFSVVQS